MLPQTGRRAFIVQTFPVWGEEFAGFGRLATGYRNVFSPQSPQNTFWPIVVNMIQRPIRRRKTHPAFRPGRPVQPPAFHASRRWPAPSASSGSRSSSSATRFRADRGRERSGELGTAIRRMKMEEQMEVTGMGDIRVSRCCLTPEKKKNSSSF